MKPAETTTPRIESLLGAAHRDIALLNERRYALLHCGIGGDHLPDDVALMAFALLGDHERDAQLAVLRPHWPALQSKGLAYGALEAAPTPGLRLLAHTLPNIAAIGPVWEKLMKSADAPRPPQGVWQCASRLSGIWGHIETLFFSVQDVAHILVNPDPIFGLQPALLTVDPDTRSTGSFSFPIDNGFIIISLGRRNGEVYRHVVEAAIGDGEAMR